MVRMHARMQVTAVQEHEHNGGKTGETVFLAAVCTEADYPEDGHDEANSFARWAPSADARFFIQNPDLFGKVQVGQLVDFDLTAGERHG